MRALFVLLLLLLTGCGSLNALNKDITQVNNNYKEVTIILPSSDRYVIIQLGSDNIFDIKNVDISDSSHKTVIPSLIDRVSVIYIFEDKSHDLSYQKGQPLYRIETSSFPESDQALVIDEQWLSPHPLEDIESVPLLSYFDIDIKKANIGNVVDFEHEVFSPEAQRMGMWQPLEFVERRYSGVFFLEPLDKNKIPVLFVHGMGGSGKEFEYIIENMDRERYQAWIVNYPSALSLTLLAHSLSSLITAVGDIYDYKEPMHIVAHSMGGVLTQHYLNICSLQTQCQRIRSFTSIASPFNGVNSAQLGVQFSPVVMPAWRDIAPNSLVIKNLFNSELSQRRPPHYLMFAFDNSGLTSRPSGDGTIVLSSQLITTAQHQAERISGYNDNHTNVLKNQQLSADLHAFWLDIERSK